MIDYSNFLFQSLFGVEPMSRTKILAPIALGSVLFSGAIASAQQAAPSKYRLGIEARSQWEGVTTKTKVGSGTETGANDSRVKNNRARVDLSGNPSAKSWYRFHFKFDADGSKKNGAGQSDNLEFFYAGYAFADNFKLDIGRMYSFNGGAYGTVFVKDIYYVAMPTAWVKNLYFTGLSGEWTFASNKLTLRFGNSHDTFKGEYTDLNPSTKAHVPAYALIYSGNFGMIIPNFAYYNFPTEQTSVTTTTGATSVTTALDKATDSNMSLGVTAIFGPKVGFSYIDYTQGERKSTAGTTVNKKVVDNSVILQADYKMGEIRPYFIFENATQKTDGDTAKDLKTTKFALIAEYSPDDAAGLTWLGGINSTSSTMGTGDTQTKTSTTGILFGATWNYAAGYGS